MGTTSTPPAGGGPARRVVSLLPSATEILFAVGAGDQVVGVTFECDFPREARERRVVSTSAMPEGLTPAGIDAFVAQAVAAGQDLYRLDADALAGLDADLVVTQDLCAVCAVDVTVVDDALAHLGCDAAVLTTDPHTLDEVVASVGAIGRAVGREDEAAEVVAGLRRRLAAAWGRTLTLRTQPRLLVLEWADPPYAPGHWVPEMVALAGAVNALGAAGEKSVRTTWEAVRAAAPDVVVCAPCGYGLAGSVAQAERLVADGVLPPDAAVWAVDADGCFARPGPRLVDGVEALAAVVAGQDPDPAVARRVREPSSPRPAPR